MTTTQRIFVCIIAAIIVVVIMGLAGLRPNGSIVALVITITAIITQKYRKERQDDDE